MNELVWQNFGAACLTLLCGWLSWRYVRPTARGPAWRRRFWAMRRARVATAILAVYAVIGLADQFRLPGVGVAGSRSPVDFLFDRVPVERTYSAPFARRVVLAAPEAGEQADAVENRVRGVHPLGTDVNGYDVLYNLCKGCGTILKLVLGTMLLSLPLGLGLGLAAGYLGGAVDDLVQWLYTTFASVPWLLFMIAFVTVFGRELLWICVAFGLTSWIELARLVRAETLKLREATYVRAARALGVPTLRILARHILPNLSHVTIVTCAITASSIVLAESVLTFIGIGVQPGSASWGLMLVEAQTELARTPPIWWVFVSASVLGILPLVMALNLLGDILREALDPRSADLT